MITNPGSKPRVDEVADGLVVDEEPLLFHTGPRRMFPLVREAVADVLPVERLRHVGVLALRGGRVRLAQRVPGRGCFSFPPTSSRNHSFWPRAIGSLSPSIGAVELANTCASCRTCPGPSCR